MGRYHTVFIIINVIYCSPPLPSPPQVGRYHKVFIMVEKNNSISRDLPLMAAQRTNLMAVDAGARYAHTFSELLRADACHLAHSCILTPPRSRSRCRYAHNCYLRDADMWNREALDCRPHLYPGDMLFFREDVWHSTQDSLLDRVSLIIDVSACLWRGTAIPTSSRSAPHSLTRTRLLSSCA